MSCVHCFCVLTAIFSMFPVYLLLGNSLGNMFYSFHYCFHILKCRVSLFVSTLLETSCFWNISLWLIIRFHRFLLLGNMFYLFHYCFQILICQVSAFVSTLLETFCFWNISLWLLIRFHRFLNNWKYMHAFLEHEMLHVLLFMYGLFLFSTKHIKSNKVYIFIYNLQLQ